MSAIQEKPFTNQDASMASWKAADEEKKRVAQLRRDELEASTTLTFDEKKELLAMRAIETHECAIQYFPFSEASLYSPILMERDRVSRQQIYDEMKEKERIDAEKENREVHDTWFPPSSLGLVLRSKTFNSRRWEIEQRGRACANPGAFFELHTQKIYNNPEYQTYALLRVNTPQRWINFDLSYTETESPLDLVREYLQQNNINVGVQEMVEQTESPISFLRVLPTAVGEPIEWTVGNDVPATYGPASLKVVTL